MMTPAAISAEIRAITADIGHPHAHIFVSISGSAVDDEVVYAAIYPQGIGGQAPSASVRAATFEGALALLRAEWGKVRDDMDRGAVRRMAFAIIEITDAFGECTDAALGRKFSPKEVERFGNKAVALADAIAGQGPFTIVATRGQNAA